ncbi:MAG TPA: phosphatidylinositol mannoside acyltransferase [Acidimicrobiales bacterium]
MTVHDKAQVVSPPPLRGLAVGQRARAIFAGYRAAAVIARALPEAALPPMTRFSGAVFSTAMPTRRAMVRRHLQRVSGGALDRRALDRAVGRAFSSYAQYWADSFRLFDVSAEELGRHMQRDGLEHLDAGIARGQGVILAVPHLGSWDWGGAWLASVGYPLTVVVEPLEPPALFDWFVEMRRGIGMTVVPLGLRAGAAVLQTLRDGGVVALLSDRDLVGTGVEVEFFGERTSLPAGPATLALRTGAALLPATMYSSQRAVHHVVIRPPLPVERLGAVADDVTRVTQALARELEDLIRLAPEQWHLFQPNWPSDPGYGV